MALRWAWQLGIPTVNKTEKVVSNIEAVLLLEYEKLYIIMIVLFIKALLIYI